MKSVFASSANNGVASKIFYAMKNVDDDSLLVKLQETNSRADMMSLHMQAVINENHALKRLLNYISSETAYNNLRYITTRVGGVAHTNPGLIYAPVSSGDGVRIGQAVINERGLIGKVVNVEQGGAEIMLVTDPRFRIPVLMRDSGGHAIFSGSTMALSFSHNESSVFNGEMAVTLGDHKSFPARLPVGVTRIIDKSPVKMTYIDVFADVAKLDYIMIIVGDSAAKDSSAVIS